MPLTLWPLVVVAVLAVVVSLPYWLPGRVIALRTLIFARVNGDEGIPVPGRRVGLDRFRELYANPVSDGRSRGAALSNLFWYWLAPGPQVHQEHLEPGPRYDEAARTTRQILVRTKEESERLTLRVARKVLDELPPGGGTVRLRDAMMPVWAELYYELVFGEPCPRQARDLIVGNARDVVTSLKCTGLRHMRRRDRLTGYLLGRLRAGDVPHPLPGSFTEQERAWYLQGAFFNTAVVQMSEAMAHVLLALARHRDVQDRLAANPDDQGYLDHVIDEAFRAYPLFGIAHRVTTGDIDLGGDGVLPAGSVLCFSYPDYHRAGYSEPDRFDPDRWDSIAARDANFIPFGVTANRPCPARGLAPVTMRIVVREVLRRWSLASSAAHTRSIPNRGPCLLLPRGAHASGGALAAMRLRDRWEDVSRSLTQLVLGSYMVSDARRKALSDTYFAQQDRAVPPSGPSAGAPSARCPVTGHSA